MSSLNYLYFHSLKEEKIQKEKKYEIKECEYVAGKIMKGGIKECESTNCFQKCGIKGCEFGQYSHALIPHFFSFAIFSSLKAAQAVRFTPIQSNEK